MDKFYIRKGSQQPHFQAIAIDGNGAVVNLGGGSCFFKMVDPLTGTTVTSASSIVDSAAGGLVRYPWTAADVSTPGIYKGTFEVYSLTGGPLRIPRLPSEDVLVVVWD